MSINNQARESLTLADSAPGSDRAKAARQRFPLKLALSLALALAAPATALGLPEYQSARAQEAAVLQVVPSTRTSKQHEESIKTAAKKRKKNKSHYDATKKPIRLIGRIAREERLTSDTGMGWSAVVYWLTFDNSVRIDYIDAWGNKTTATFSRIAVYALEQYGDNANKNLSSIKDNYWQSYIGKKVTVKGTLFDTGNAHTYGYANFKDARIVSK